MAAPLDPSEVEALMQAISEGQIPAETAGQPGGHGPVVSYDLTSQDRIIRGQMPTLDSINDRVASMFGRTLSGRTRLELRIASTPASLMKFADVNSLLNDQVVVGVMSLGAGHGLALIILDGALGQGLLAAAMGDRGGKIKPEDVRSELTRVERVVLRHVLTMFTEAVETCWKDVLELKPELLRFETDARMAAIAAPSDVAILCSFEVTGTIDGRLMMAVPYAAVESVKKALSSPPRLDGQRDARFGQSLAHELEQVAVELRVEIGRHQLRLSDLLGLKVGDVVTLNTSESSPLPVLIQGRPKLTASPRVVGGGMAVEILKTPWTPGGRGRGAVQAFAANANG